MIYVACCIIVCLSAYVGKIVAKTYVLKDRFYKQMLVLCDSLLNNINFKQSKLSEVLCDFNNLLEKNINEQFEIVKNVILKKVDKQSFENSGKLYFLNREEKNELYRQLSDIGNGNDAIEKQKYDTLKYYIIQKSCEAEEKRKRNESLCYKLSISVGVVISILIV